MTIARPDKTLRIFSRRQARSNVARDASPIRPDV